MTEVNVGKCADCPFVKKECRNLGALRTLSDTLTSLAKTNNIDERAVDVFELVTAHGIELPPDDDGKEITSQEDLAAQLRKSTADILNRLDEDATETENLIRHTTFVCEGPLKMRSQKAGRTIVATVCNTPLVPNGDSLEFTQINRTFTN